MQVQQVSELMRDTGAVTLPQDTQLRDAAEILLTLEHPLLIITDDNDTFLGVVSEAAVVRLLLSTSDKTATLEPIVSRHVESALVDATLSSVMHLFRSNCHTVVPVVDSERRVVGLLHRRDVVRALLDESPAEKPSSNEVAEDSSADESLRGPHFKRNRPDATQSSGHPYSTDRKADQSGQDDSQAK